MKTSKPGRIAGVALSSKGAKPNTVSSCPSTPDTPRKTMNMPHARWPKEWSDLIEMTESWPALIRSQFPQSLHCCVCSLRQTYHFGRGATNSTPKRKSRFLWTAACRNGNVLISLPHDRRMDDTFRDRLPQWRCLDRGGEARWPQSASAAKLNDPTTIAFRRPARR